MAYEDRDNPEVWPEEIDPFAAELARAQERLGLKPTTSQNGVETKKTAHNNDEEEEDSGDEDISKYDLLADERSDGEIPSD